MRNPPNLVLLAKHILPSAPIALVIAALVGEIILCYMIAYALFTFIQNVPSLFRRILQKCGVGEKETPQIFLELTFPADTTKSAFATEQLHILLRGLVKYYGFWDRLAARKKPYSLELVGTNDDGIRYILMIPESELETVQHNLLSFLPGLKVRQVEDYVATIPEDTTQVVELRLTGDFILPLKSHKTLQEHDPFAYFTGHMTKLTPNELIAFQIVTVPVYRNTHHRASRRQRSMQTRITLGKDVSSKLEQQRKPLGHIFQLLWSPLFWLLSATGKFIGIVVDIFITTSSDSHDLPVTVNSRDQHQLGNPYELEMGQRIKEKLDQQLFEVTIRILVSSPGSAAHNSRVGAIVESFRPFQSTYQSLDTRRPMPFLLPRSKQFTQFKARALSPHHMNQQTILSSSELSDLYHFPNTDLTKTEGFVKSRSRELAVPLSIRQSDANLDVVVGVNEHGGDHQAIGMTLEQRQKHTYVIGKTGTGKTTLLKSSIYQDMVNSKGLAVFDPHGDMFQELLAIVPENRREDVVVFDPSDEEWPIGLNILDPGIEFASEQMRQAKITSMVLSVFRKLADDAQWGPRMEHILRNATLTALHLPNPSLYTLQRLLTDKKYQREVAKSLDDPVLKQFWDKEFKLLGTMQLSSVTAPLTHRLGHFITSKMSRHILLQEKSTVRIADIMNEGKILLVNLSKGDIGEDQSLFFGTILTSFIWMAAYQRTKIPEKQRRDFFVYVDEFQNFATPQFSDITSEGRKYHVSLIVSHQNIAQIEDKAIVKVVASNASTIICLKVGPEDEAFILPYMKPEVESGDIVNLAPYHFYMKTTGDVSEDAFSGITVPVEVEESSEVKDAVIAYSRKQYGTPVTEVEGYMRVLFGQEEPEAKEKISDVPAAKQAITAKPKKTQRKSNTKSPKTKGSGVASEG